MKTIVVVRHGKAESEGYNDDFSRRLTDRGENDALKIAAVLNSKSIKPDYILSSPAQRALSTATIFAEVLGFPKSEITEKKGIYFTYRVLEIIELINEAPETANTLFIFGHNPTVFYLCEALAKTFNNDMPTCSTVVISFECNKWAEVAEHQGKVLMHLTPSTVN